MATIELQRNSKGKIKKNERESLTVPGLGGPGGSKTLTGAFGIQNADNTEVWGPRSLKCWQYHGFGAARPKKVDSSKVGGLWGSQMLTVTRSGRAGRLQTLTVLRFGGVGTRKCSHYQGRQRKTKGNQRKSLRSKGFRDTIKGKRRSTQISKRILKIS